MPNNRLTVDRPFADQPAAKEILKHSKYLVPKALIPKATLSKIHGLAKQLIIDELGPEKEIVRLRIGYYAPLIESEEVGQLYSFEPGKIPTNDEDNPDSNSNIETKKLLSSEFVSQLSQRIREEIIRQTPPIALESRALHIDFLFAVKIFNALGWPSVRRRSGLLGSSESSESIRNDSGLLESSKPSDDKGNYTIYIKKIKYCCDSQGNCCQGKIIKRQCVCNNP